MERHEQIREAYKELGGDFANIYDGYITYSTLSGKLMSRLMWGFNKETNAEWIRAALSCVPDDFSGKMLEVPIGTGVLTIPVYKGLSSADITCLDYSPDMMRNAERRAEAIGVSNVRFVQGDVGELPFEDEVFDIVLSLNGFHAFPDKEAAYRETFRVLKKGGLFGGCFYVSGEKRRTDFMAKHLFVPKGSFTPPFETKGSLRGRLEAMYDEVRLTVVNAMASFCCRK